MGWSSHHSLPLHGRERNEPPWDACGREHSVKPWGGGVMAVLLERRHSPMAKRCEPFQNRVDGPRVPLSPSEGSERTTPILRMSEGSDNDEQDP